MQPLRPLNGTDMAGRPSGGASGCPTSALSTPSASPGIEAHPRLTGSAADRSNAIAEAADNGGMPVEPLYKRRGGG